MHPRRYRRESLILETEWETPDGSVCVIDLMPQCREAADVVRIVEGRSGETRSSFTAIGAFSEATLGYYDLDRQEYLEIPVDEQMEVLTLAGDITRDGKGGWLVHAHVVCGRRDGSTVGGHLLRAITRPALEFVLTSSPTHLQRRHDDASGLALIALLDRGASRPCGPCQEYRRIGACAALRSSEPHRRWGSSWLRSPSGESCCIRPLARP